MISNAEARKNRRELLRAIALEHKRKDRETLARLREKIRAVKKRRSRALCKVRGYCQRGRARAKQSAKAQVAEIRAAARAQIEHVREKVKLEARRDCAARKEAVRRAALSATHRRRELLAAERALQDEIKRIEGWAKARHREHKYATAKELRQESDDAVRRNIPDELRPLFERVKRQIKGSTRRSRTEEFLQYVEENPGELVDMQQEIADREVARLVREYHALDRAMRSPARYRPSAAELADIPF